MANIEVKLNGQKIKTKTGITILDLAKQHGINIPTLCHDEELNPYGSCWVCAVEVKGRRGFVTSCGTYLSDGMEIITDSEDIRKARKVALELLISNHYADCEAPCKIACPNNVDVQAYVSLIANGQYHEAVKVLKDTLPMPLSIGRVCPAFCEKECRRQLVEDPIAIRQLKRFCADEDLNDAWSYVPEKLPEKGKKVAIIGAGPSGLTCGFYLSNMGYEVVVYESAAAAGGWLRYGIPEYRLPKAILDKEIELMCMNGMSIEYGKQLGRDFTLSNLCKSYDAVYVAIGAQKAVDMPVQGSDLQGCYLGVDFLRAFALGQTPEIGKKVAIVGGGNTAIDCARTSLRLGADVTIIYRRTKGEMPAEPFEIEASEHEGIHFHYLSNPVEYLGSNGKLTGVKIEKMKLGEPDAGGRRRPEPTGEYFEEQFDSIIAAISQVPDVEVFKQEDNYIEGQIFPISRWSTAIADEETMYVGLGNVFAGGDFRRGAATAIEAIADGRRASEMIDKFLQDEVLKQDALRFDSKKGKKIKQVSPDEYQVFDKAERIKMPEIPVKEASTSFKEVELGFTEEQAKTEAERCLECGCQVNSSCFLREYCTDYEVDAAKFIGSIGKHPIDASHPFILRDQNKCINCGRCIRTCAEIQGAAVLGYIYRGFPTVVAPEFGASLTDTSCESCGKCINVCPVGALVERNLYYKNNPLCKEAHIQNCGICGTGCIIKTETQTNKTVNITTPDEKDWGNNKDERFSSTAQFNGRNLCFKGRFGWQVLEQETRLHAPMLKSDGSWREISWEEAATIIKDKSQGSKSFAISPFITLEEMLLVESAAKRTNAELGYTGYHALFTDKLIMSDTTSSSYPQLDEFGTYVIFGEISHTLRTTLRLKQRKGKKLYLAEAPESGFNRFADGIYTKLEEVPDPKDKLFIYNQNHVSEAEIYRLYKHAYQEGLGNILATSDYPNLLGMLAITDKAVTAEAEFMLSWGASLQSVSHGFKVEVLPFMMENINADLILPMPSYKDIDGTALANNGLITHYFNSTKSVLFDKLLHLFVAVGWLSGYQVESRVWEQQAHQKLNQLSVLEPVVFKDIQVLKDSLSKEVYPADCQINRKIDELYKMRKIKTDF